jgi:hypothetical protein
VWEIVSVWRDYAPDRDAFDEHFGPNVTREMLDQALAYGDRFGDEVEAMIQQNQRMERIVAGQG